MSGKKGIMPLAIRLLAVDVDGTLLDSQHRLPPRNAAALAAAAARGVVIALATGRRFNFVRPIAAALGCPSLIVASNGALVREAAAGGEPGREWFRHFLPRRKARAVLATLARYRDQAVVTMPEDGAAAELYMTPERDPSAAERRAFATWVGSNRDHLAYSDPLERCLTTDPIQLMYGGSVAAVRAIAEELAAAPLGTELTLLRTLYPRRDLGILDILDAGVDKGAALAAVASRLAIPAAAVAAIGDNYNDVGMLTFAGRAVLMGNAHAAMDRPGWARTADNDQDGVARAVEMLGLAAPA